MGIEANFEGDDVMKSGPLDPDQLFPCTPYQERRVQSDRRHPGGTGNVVALRWKLTGEIAPDIAEQALASLIDRHEIFRTAFVEVDGVQMQHILPKVDFKLIVEDLSALPEGQRLDRADEIGRAETRQPFNIETPPLLRAVFVQLDAETVILHIAFHNAVVDGWSFGVIIREFGQIAEALQNGVAPELPPVALQFADYAIYQQEMLQSGALNQSKAYWSRQLSGAPHTELPTDKTRPAVMNGAGDIRSLVLPADVNAKLSGYARVTGHTTFLAASVSLASMLREQTGETDITIAAPAVSRDEVELEQMVGPEMNTLVMRVDASGDPSFEELGDRCSDVVADGLEHAKLSFETVADMLGAPEDASRSPLCSVMLMQQTAFIDSGKSSAMEFGKFKIATIPSLPCAAQTDLFFFMVGRDEGWRLSCEYNVDLFESATIDRLLRRWAQTIEAMVLSDGQAKIASVAYADIDRFTPGPLPGLAAQLAAAAGQPKPAAAPTQAPAAQPSAVPTAPAAVAADLTGELLTIWSEILDRPHLHAQSDFFDNGGHSLSAMRMITRVNKAFDIKLRVAALFKAPTVEKFAAVIVSERPDLAVAPSAPVQPVPAPAVAAPAPQPVAAPAPAAGGAQEVEAQLVEIWSEILDRSGLHAQSDFFDNGGHSLSAMRMITRVNKAFDIKLRVAALFKAPTVQKFAAAIVAERPELGAAPAAIAAPLAAPASVAAPVPAPAYGGSNIDVVAQLLPIWSEVLDRQDLHAQSDFFDNGGHSLSAMRMITRVNKTFNIKLRVAALFKASTVARFADAIIAERPDLAPVAVAAPVGAPPAVPAAQDNGLIPVMALNNGSAFVLVQRRMTGDREFIDIPVGHAEDTEFAKTHTLPETVERVVARIQAERPHGPYFLLAYCGLAPIVTEAVRQLEAKGEQVWAVSVLDSFAPGYFKRLSRMGKFIRLMTRIKRAGGYFVELFKEYWAGQISLAFFLEHYGFIRKLGVVPFLAKLGLVKPHEEGAEEMDGLNFFDVMDAAGYRDMDEPINARVITFRSQDMYTGRFFPEAMGWKAINHGEVQEYLIPCEHREMTRDPFASLLGIYLDKALLDIEAAEKAKQAST